MSVKVTGLAVSALAALTMMLGAAGTRAATTPHNWYVDDDGTASSTGCSGTKHVPTSIQAAINAAAAGDTVYVCPGIYVERLDISKKVFIVAVQAGTATLKAPSNGVAAGAVLIDIHAPEAAIYRMNLVIPTSGTCVSYSDAIRISKSPAAQVRETSIAISGTESSCHYLNGINVISGQQVQIEKDTITDFTGTGIIAGGKYQLIQENKIKFLHSNLGPNAIAGARGIDITGPTTATPILVLDNVVKSAMTAGATTPKLAFGLTFRQIQPTITANTISYTDTAIKLTNTTGGTAFNNVASSGITTGFAVSTSSGYEITGNRLSASTVGLSVTSGSANNNIHDNDARGPSTPDCSDTTSGTGTSGTANTWTNNVGTSSNPARLCVPIH